MFFAEDTLSGHERFAAEVAAGLSAYLDPWDAKSGAAEELAFAVAEYTANHVAPGHAVAASDIVFLTARSLWAVGKAGQSREFIRKRSGELGLPAECEELADCDEASLPVWRLTVERRLKRRFSSMLTGGAMWVVNLSEALPRDKTAIELTLYATLDALLTRIAFFWDKTSGSGIFGLRGLGNAALRVCGKQSGKRAVETLCGEAIGFCKDNLAKTSKERAWTAAPMVLRLDV